MTRWVREIRILITDLLIASSYVRVRTRMLAISYLLFSRMVIIVDLILYALYVFNVLVIRAFAPFSSPNPVLRRSHAAAKDIRRQI